MPNQTGSSNAPLKPVKLRESCDKCLLAKVKCSKARPMCSRCLSHGGPCDYSPSSRSGKRNRSATSNDTKRSQGAIQKLSIASGHSLPLDPVCITRSAFTFSGEGGSDLIFHNKGSNIDGAQPSSYVQHDRNKKAPFPRDNGSIAPDSDSTDSVEFISTPSFSDADFVDPFLSMNGSDQNPFAEFKSTPSSPTISMNYLPPHIWLPKETNSFRFSDTQEPSSHVSADRHQNLQMNLQAVDQSLLSCPQYEPDFEHTLNERRQTCDCFAACLHVLQSLHTHSVRLSAGNPGRPPFDIILSINRDAIDSSLNMLNCAHCTLKSGRTISTTMLATVFGMAISIYKATCLLQFRCIATNTMQTSAQLAFGTYTVTGENRQLLEIEILLLELRKFERVLQLFSERFCAAQNPGKGEEARVNGALVSRLEKGLNDIIRFLQTRKVGI